jgi:hypothetical protein
LNNRTAANFRPKLISTHPLERKLLRNSHLLLHCCNTRLLIEDESRRRVRSSLVIRFVADQDISKEGIRSKTG